MMSKKQIQKEIERLEKVFVRIPKKKWKKWIITKTKLETFDKVVRK